MHASLRIPGELYFSGAAIQPQQASLAELSRFTGSFHSDELDTSYTLSINDGHLTLKLNSAPTTLEMATKDEFYSSEFGTLVFHMDSANHVSGFSVFTQQARGIIFKKVN